MIALAEQSGPSNRILLIAGKDLEAATSNREASPETEGSPDFLAFLLGLCDEQWDRRDYAKMHNLHSDGECVSP